MRSTNIISVTQHWNLLLLARVLHRSCPHACVETGSYGTGTKFCKIFRGICWTWTNAACFLNEITFNGCLTKLRLMDVCFSTRTCLSLKAISVFVRPASYATCGVPFTERRVSFWATKWATSCSVLGRSGWLQRGSNVTLLCASCQGQALGVPKINRPLAEALMLHSPVVTGNRKVRPRPLRHRSLS